MRSQTGAITAVTRAIRRKIINPSRSNSAAGINLFSTVNQSGLYVGETSTWCRQAACGPRGGLLRVSGKNITNV
jgi:hypothetical protein